MKNLFYPEAQRRAERSEPLTANHANHANMKENNTRFPVIPGSSGASPRLVSKSERVMKNLVHHRGTETQRRPGRSGIMVIALGTFLLINLAFGLQADSVAATNETAKLEIVKAVYGDFSNPYAIVDVTAAVSAMVRSNTLDMAVKGAFEDPAEGCKKLLKVDYKINGVVRSRVANEDSRMRILARPNAGSSKLVIRKAVYGDLPDGTLADVTELLETMVSSNRLVLTVNKEVFDDPAPGKHKQLKVDYVVNGVEGSKTLPEEGKLRLSANETSASSKLVIRKAVFGDLSDGKIEDVTALLATMVSKDRLEVMVNNLELGDPAPQKRKQLKVDYTLNGVQGSRTVPELYTFRLSAVPSKLVIRNAQYFVPDGKTNDVTALLSSMIWDDQLDLKVSSDEFGNPGPFNIKQLRVDYELDGVPVSKKLFEGARLRISAADDPYAGQGRKSTKLVIRQARYGDLPDGVYNDVTEILASMIKNDALEVTAHNDIFGDPVQAKKKLQVEFTLNGKEKSKRVEEGQVLKIE